MKSKKVNKGDYVLATKYSDGDCKDEFAVGFFNGMLIDRYGKTTDRYMVVDNKGKNFRGNGFRRCEKISKRVGKTICDNIKIIEHGCVSVWYWRRNVKKLEELKQKMGKDERTDEKTNI